MLQTYRYSKHTWTLFQMMFPLQLGYLICEGLEGKVLEQGLMLEYWIITFVWNFILIFIINCYHVMANCLTSFRLQPQVNEESCSRAVQRFTWARQYVEMSQTNYISLTCRLVFCTVFIEAGRTPRFSQRQILSVTALTPANTDVINHFSLRGSW